MIISGIVADIVDGDVQGMIGADLETIYEHDNDENGAPLMIPFAGFDDDDDDDDRDLLSLMDSRFLEPNCPTECLLKPEDIDFEFVYALHTFVATVEGQANATKGDTMVLLDDSNSYWWLVRVVKDSSIGEFAPVLRQLHSSLTWFV